MAHRRTSAVAVAAIERLGLAVAIGGAFVASGAVFVAFYGAAPPGPLLSILAAALVALAAGPTRRLVRRLANLVVYGDPASPAELVRQLSLRMAHGRDPDELLAGVARLIRAGTGAAAVVVWLRLGRGWAAVAVAPAPAGPAGSAYPVDSAGPTGSAGPSDSALLVPIRHAGEELGVIAVGGVSTLSPYAERLVRDLALHAAVITRTLHLRENLLRELETARERRTELVAARRHLVAVQDAERRRLERDIHDTCQQQATLIAGRVGLAGVLASTDPEAARAELRLAAADADRLAARLGRLTSGSVADLVIDGAGAALVAELAGLPVAIVVEDGRSRPCPPELEATLYFCAMEAIQNAMRHADPTSIQIGLSNTDGRVLLTVRDDGAGFRPDVGGTGNGLRNLRERLEPWSGTLTVRSSAHGTELRVVAHAGMDAA